MSKYMLKWDNGAEEELHIYNEECSVEMEIAKLEKHYNESPDIVHSAKKVVSYRITQA